MEGLYFNVDNGYAEALIRGHLSAMLTESEYVNMTHCDTLEDLRLQLSATDYGDSVANIPSPIVTNNIHDKVFSKLISEFRYIQSTAVSPLSDFLRYITYSYMIDNVVLLISGTAHNHDRDELLARCHPLGWFDTLPALSITTDVNSLYETVLIDTPLAPYFKDCLTAEELTDLQIEIVRNKLWKAYLEDFDSFCKTLPSPSKEIMQKFLSFEADRRTINVALNSLNTDLSRPERLALMSSLGSLSSAATIQLSRTEDAEQIRSIIETYGGPELQNLFDTSGTRSLEDNIYDQELKLCRMAFTQQFTYSTFYAWLRAAEQEVRNITWIAECIAQNQKSRINNFISIF